MNDTVKFYNLHFNRHLYPFMNYRQYLEKIQTIKDFIEVGIKYYIVEVIKPSRTEYYALLDVENIRDINFLMDFISVEESPYGSKRYYLVNITNNTGLLEFLEKLLRFYKKVGKKTLQIKIDENIIEDAKSPHVVISEDQIPIESELFAFLYNRFKFFNIVARMNDKLIYSRKNKMIISKLITVSKLEHKNVVNNKMDIVIHLSSVRKDSEYVELLETFTKEYKRQVLEIEEKYWNKLKEKVRELEESLGIEEILPSLEKYRLKINVEIRHDTMNYIEFTVFDKKHITNDVFSHYFIDAIIYRVYSSLLWTVIEYIKDTYNKDINYMDVIMGDITEFEESEEEEIEEVTEEKEGFIEKIKKILKR